MVVLFVGVCDGLRSNKQSERASHEEGALEFREERADGAIEPLGLALDVEAKSNARI